MTDGALLSQALRDGGPVALARLLHARPDLAGPMPASLAELVARALSTASSIRALARLDAQALRVLSGLVAEVDEELLTGLGPRQLSEVVEELAVLGLVWGVPPHPGRAVRQLLGAPAAGLAPASSEALSPDQITDALARTTEEDRTVLDRMVWGPPYGSVERATRPIDSSSDATPVDRLLRLGLLRPVDASTVILPREVALARRGGRLYDLDAGLPPLPRFAIDGDDRLEISATMLDALAAWLLGEFGTGDWRSVLDEAATDDHWVRLAYVNDDGTLGLDVVRVLSIGQGTAFLVRRGGPRLNVPLARVVAAEGVAPVVINDLPALPELQ